MKHITGIISGLFVAVVVYLFIGFFANKMVDGLGTAIEIGVHVLVILIAIAASLSSARAAR